MIIPGLVDLHTHAPQYAFRGMGMDLELLEWLYKYTFPEESRYESLEYAEKAYPLYVEDLRKSFTTRAVIFSTIHRESALFLVDQLEKTGLITCVGKVNMDRNAPEYYIEKTENSLRETERFIRETRNYKRTKAILTPRFIPTCTDELMRGLSGIQKESGLGLQSHLSENRNEIQWVKELCPDAEFYGDAYDRFGLFGGKCKTVMAHCVLSGEDETQLMRERGVYIAHCPSSNMNLSSGIAPIRKFITQGVKVGLGTDLAAGHSMSIVDEMICAVQASKMRWRYVSDEEPINILDAFYMATRGGGEFFGKVGSFDKGYEFDALVIDDSKSRSSIAPDDRSRFLRSLYLHHECSLRAKYVCGKKIDIS